MNDCAYAQTDVPVRYLHGRLEAAESEAFEEHYFACERCWRELEVGLAFRQKTRRSWPIPVGIAAAAILVFGSAWIFLARRVPDQAPVYRSARTTMAVTATGTTVTWNAVEGAASYTVTLFAADGTELGRTPTTTTTLAIPQGGGRFVRVEAIDPDGNRIATSSLEPLKAGQ